MDEVLLYVLASVGTATLTVLLGLLFYRWAGDFTSWYGYHRAVREDKRERKAYRG